MTFTWILIQFSGTWVKVRLGSVTHETSQQTILTLHFIWSEITIRYVPQSRPSLAGSGEYSTWIQATEASRELWRSRWTVFSIADSFCVLSDCSSAETLGSISISAPAEGRVVCQNLIFSPAVYSLGCERDEPLEENANGKLAFFFHPRKSQPLWTLRNLMPLCWVDV